jgi:SAM-dependent methyltransferase
VTYRVYDGRRLPFPDGHFDVSFAACVLHHVPPPQWDGFVAELHRVTCWGGLVVLFEHNPANPLTRRAVRACPFDEDVVLLRPQWVTAACRRAGGRVLARRYTMFAPVDWRLVRRAERTIGRMPLGAQYMVASTPSGPAPATGSLAELAQERVAG